MITGLSNKYFLKRLDSDSWRDVTSMFDGIKILSISGFNEEGEAQNIYTAKWVNSRSEDYFLDGDSVIRSNVDLEMTFIAGTRYSANGNVDTQTAYDSFKDYICNHGDFYIMSAYIGKHAHVVCLKGVKPTTEKLHRGQNSYIIATAYLHCLSPAKKG